MNTQKCKITSVISIKRDNDIKPLLFIFILLLFIVPNKLFAQQYQWLLNNPLVTDPNTNYTLNSGLISHQFDSLHQADTSNHGYIPGEKSFQRWKFIQPDRSYMSGTQIGGDIFTSAKIGNKVLANEITPCSNTDFPWTLVGPQNTNIATLGIIMAIAVNPINPQKIYAGTQASGLWYTENGGTNWVNITDVLHLPALGISWISFDPADNTNNTVFYATGAHGHSGMVGYGAGLFKVINGGTPTNVIDFGVSTKDAKDFFISKFVFHPTNNNIIYAISTRYFYKLIKNTQTGFWDEDYKKDAEDPNDPLYAGGSGSYKSYLMDLEVQFVGGVLQIYVSSFCHKLNHTPLQYAKAWHNNENLNQSWNEIYTDLPDYGKNRYISLEVSENDPSILYCMVNQIDNFGQESRNVQLYKSINSGQIFTLIKNKLIDVHNPAPSGNHLFIISDINKNVAFIGENELLKSTNFQSNADFDIVSVYSPNSNPNSNLSTTHADIRSIVEIHIYGAEIENHYFFIGHDGGISRAKTLDQDGTWANKIAQNYWDNINGNLVLGQVFGFDIQQNGFPYIGLQDNGSQRFNGTTWVQESWGDGAAIRISKSDPSIKYYQTNGNISGSQFSYDAQGASQNFPMILDPKDDRSLFIGDLKLIYFNKQTNKIDYLPAIGDHLTSIYNDWIRAIDVSISDPNVIFVSALNPLWDNDYVRKIFKSTNGGQSFTDITANVDLTYDGALILRKAHVTTIKIHPQNAQIIYMGLSSFLLSGNNSNQGEYRVIKSTDGGDTWNDMSVGLPAFPVTTLIYQQGTDEVLYAGTDFGIYRWNKATQTWECYSNGLPKVIITNLEIDYCRSKILCSTWGRGIYQADLKPVNIPYEISQSQTWGVNTFHNFNTSVVVKNGATLTINGNVSFATDKYLQIEAGGKVIVDGGKLYNLCGNNWEGIHVAGNPALAQYPISNQGYLYLKDAEIQNADVAVSTAALDNNGKIIWSRTGGGIVIATNTIFKNNKRHVEFMEYKKSMNYAGLFTNCNFELNTTCDANDLTALKSMYMVTVWGAHGVKFDGCEFKNINGAAFAGNPNWFRGTGIYTLDATVKVSGISNFMDCAIEKRGLFSNLTNGIHSAHSPSFTLSGKTNIKEQDFELNDKGILLENGVTYNIFKNNFSLYVPDYYYNRLYSPYDYELGYSGIAGVHTKECSGFMIEENNFSQASPIFELDPPRNPTEVIIGTVFDNSDASGGGGYSRLNHLGWTNIGSQTQNSNQSLQITCNQFIDAFKAMNMNPISTTFLTPVFGECHPLLQDLRTDYNNTFFTNLTYDAAHYANFTKSYVVKPGEPNRPDPNMTLNVDVNNCQNQIPGSVISIKDNCTRTPAFQNNCETAGEVFNGGILTEYYLNKTNRQYWQDAINNDELEGAALLEATQNLRYYTIETNQSRNNAIWTYNQMGLFDSTFNSPQNIISFLENETDEVARKQLIGTLYAVGLYNLALQYLSELNGTSTENADFISYYSILINATNNGRNIYELHEEEWQLLEAIAQGGNTASLSAQGIISLVQGRHCNSILERKLNEELLIKKGTPTIKDEVTDSGNNQSFKVYPNPAGNFVNVEFQSNSSLMNKEIILTDAIGEILFVSPTNLARGNLTINTSNLSDGFYFVSIIINGKTEIVKKLIINH